MRLSSLARLVMLAALVLIWCNRPQLAAQTAAGEKVVGGPYVVHAGERSATVMWVVESGQVSVGSQAGKPDKTAPVLHVERTALYGLKPGTVYHYDAFPGEAGKGSFKTAPSGPAPFQFIVYGDTRTRHDVHRRVIDAIVKYAHPDFVVHTGDLVENGPDPSLWPIFFDIERELLRKAAIFSTLGNHERNSDSYFDYMDAKPYYSFNWGGGHFAVIDSDIGNVGNSQADKDAFWKEQTSWLEADLENAQKSDFRFVVAHHPPMTAVRRRQGDNPQMTALEPLFEKYRVSAGLFGHDHNYQHYLKNGVHYFICGGGGAPLYDVDLPPPGITKKVESTENFMIVDVNGAKAHVEAKRPDGSTIETSELGDSGTMSRTRP